MSKLLVDIGNMYLNRTNIILICKVMFVLQICLVFIVIRAMGINGILGQIAEIIWEISLYGKLYQLAQDMGLAFLFLGLMTSIYRKGVHVPFICYLIIILFGMGILTFIANVTGAHRGAFFFLSGIVTSVLQVLVGYHLQKTDFAGLGKFVMAYPIVFYISMLFFPPASVALMIIVILNNIALVYAFYKEPLLMR